MFAMDAAHVAQLVHYICPAVILAYLVADRVWVWRTGSETTTKNMAVSGRSIVRLVLVIGLVLSYVAESGAVILRVFVDDVDSERHVSLFLLACTLEWLYVLSQGADSTRSQVAPAVVTALAELALIAYPAVSERSVAEHVVVLAAHIARAACATSLLAAVLVLAGLQDHKSQTPTQPSTPDEAEALLGHASECAAANGAANGAAGGTHANYGSTGTKDDDDADEEPEYGQEMKERQKKRREESGSWFAYVADYFIFLPMLLPRRDRKVQACAVLLLACLAAERALNLLVPRQVGIVANKLTDSWGKGVAHAPFKDVVVLVVLARLRSAGALDVVQSLATVPIEQFSYRQVTQAAFRHVMSLSVDFHVDQNSGELIRALDQGRSLTDLLKLVLTELLPELLDVAIALVYLYFVFGAGACVTIMLAAAGFFWTDARTTDWIMPLRRRFIKKSRDQYKRLHQAVQGWQNVSYFNRFAYEDERMAAAVADYQALEAAYRLRQNAVNVLRNTAISLGFLAILSLSVLRVARGQTDVGSFVTLYSYWGTLISPIGFMGSYYRWISSLLVDAERLLALFQTRPSIVDAPDAAELPAGGPGRITLRGVDFAYDPRRQVVRGVDLAVEPGTTVAFVGETGAGKSTLLKLVYRLYDVTGGAVAVDGHDVRAVTLRSLRETMGVVPQDPMLFNASIMENLRYARLDASDAEVHAACRAACIHDRIMTFPDRYRSRVGERGVKLSGGELQRVAIARVLLKRPRIVLLDEATSAVDTDTEQQVQAAISRLGEGRTTLVIAHRLSTIVKADVIVVMEDGRIIERGTHHELLALDGKYSTLWGKQVAHL